jgi:2'-hydroxyisoflavone reductase
MRFLVIGGTRFVGRAFVEAALARGHEVTLFHRGRTRTDLFPGVERVLGDRHEDLAALAGRRWDAVYDTCGFTSTAVRRMAEAVRDGVETYVFISSLSVFADNETPNRDEDARLEEFAGETEDANDIATYGARKVLCERAAEAAMPGRVLTLRPGLIVGPWDYVDRFAYWVSRLARGGEVLAPGRPQKPLELIDVRDLGEWSVRLLEARTTGVFNVTGPAERLTWNALLETLRAAAGSDARFAWVDDDFLVAHEVGVFGELPFWIPASDGENFFSFDVSKAIRNGLTFRPLLESARDTLAWLRERALLPPPTEDPRLAGLGRVGMDEEREAALLAEWHARSAAAR